MVESDESLRTNVKQSRMRNMDCFEALPLAMTRGRGAMVESDESLRTNVKQSRMRNMDCFVANAPRNDKEKGSRNDGG